MGAAKWIVGFLGWVAFGPIGALVGFMLGTAVDDHIDVAKQIRGSGNSGGQTYTSGSQRTGGYRTTYTPNEQRNSFMISLLVLSSAVIKADGRTLQAELNCVREFIRKNFGESAVNEAMNIFERVHRQEYNLYQVGAQIATNMNYSQRLQLFHYLVQIATSDREFSKSEKDVLESIASAIHLNTSDAASTISMYYKDAKSAYSVLEISPNATDDEVKSAYRRMAMKNHPDKVATLGPEVQRAAAEKFRKIQEAYETIKKERGMS